MNQLRDAADESATGQVGSDQLPCDRLLDAGETTADTHPGHSGIDARYDELQIQRMNAAKDDISSRIC